MDMGNQLRFTGVSIGEGKKVFWHFELDVMVILRPVRSWRGHARFMSPLQIAKNIKN
jgi:hypothetical protein